MHINAGMTVYGRQGHSQELIQSLAEIAREDGAVNYNGHTITYLTWWDGHVSNTGEFFEVFGQVYTTLIEAIDYCDQRLGVTY